MNEMIEGRASSPGPVIVIDSREQLPYQFDRSVTKTLVTADYSILGLEEMIAIERKTKKDAYSSLGLDRRRFRHEVERLSALDYAAIVIEASLPDFIQPPSFSKMNPNSAVQTLLAWSVKYGVHIFFAGDRRHGNALTRSLLEKYWRCYQEIQRQTDGSDQARQNECSS